MTLNWPSSGACYILKTRPDGLPGLENFIWSQEETREPEDGELLLQTLMLSIEPYMVLGMKGAMDSDSAKDATRGRLLALCDRYVAGVKLGAAMYGPTISRVIASRRAEFAADDLVISYSGWRAYAIDDGATVRKIDVSAAPASAYLGVLGLPGLTAYSAMRTIGMPKPGDTAVISAAMGPVGSLAGQIAKIHGARVVGIASGPDKCLDLVAHLGFDAGIDRLSPDFPAALAKACPDGVDIYFENVGGPVWWAVFPLLNALARVPISGLASHYAAQGADSVPDRTAEVMQKIQLQRISLRGLSVFDHAALEDDFQTDVSDWIADGRVRYREQIVDGLENAPQALADVLTGRNHGKMIIRVAD